MNLGAFPVKLPRYWPLSPLGKNRTEFPLPTRASSHRFALSKVERFVFGGRPWEPHTILAMTSVSRSTSSMIEELIFKALRGLFSRRWPSICFSDSLKTIIDVLIDSKSSTGKSGCRTLMLIRSFLTRLSRSGTCSQVPPLWSFLISSNSAMADERSVAAFSLPSSLTAVCAASLANIAAFAVRLTFQRVIPKPTSVRTKPSRPNHPLESAE
jgi:hypothetical protein